MRLLLAALLVAGAQSLVLPAAAPVRSVVAATSAVQPAAPLMMAAKLKKKAVLKKKKVVKKKVAPKKKVAKKTVLAKNKRVTSEGPISIVSGLVDGVEGLKGNEGGQPIAIYVVVWLALVVKGLTGWY